MNQQANAMLAFLVSMFGDLRKEAEAALAQIPTIREAGRARRPNAHQVDQVITGLIVVIVVSVSVVIVSRFNSSMGGVENSQLSEANQSVLTGFADMVGLIAPLLLIIIAVVIIAYVQRIRG
ncbi:hypothetical protein [Halobacterium hubeiense]|uniref:hypothetical protein n=1 Tax=Halobacterium hubeiense TaxID=1407499 RepID=UPI003C735D69